MNLQTFLLCHFQIVVLSSIDGAGAVMCGTCFCYCNATKYCETTISGFKTIATLILWLALLLVCHLAIAMKQYQ